MNEFIQSEKFAGRLEIVVAVLMGITAVLIAFTSWQGSLYGGNSSTKYTKSNALISEANSMYNEAAQYIAQDMETWNTISGLRIEIAFAEQHNDSSDLEKLEWKLDQIMADNVSETLEGAIEWADSQPDYASPFDKEGFVDSYYDDAHTKYQEGDEMIQDGQKDNALGDKLGLVTVIFSVALFLLGIVVVFKNNAVKLGVFIVSCCALVYGAVMMFGVPMLSL